MMASDGLGPELTEEQILNGWGNLGPVVVRILRRVTALENWEGGALDRHFDSRCDALSQRLDALEQTVKANDEARHLGEGELRGYNQALERAVVRLEARLPAPVSAVTPLAGAQVGPGAVAPNLALPDYLLAPAPDYRSELPADEACYECGTNHGPDQNTLCPLSSVYNGPSVSDEAVTLRAELRATIERMSAELADATKLYNGALDAQAEAEQKWFDARNETKQLRSDLQWETDQRRHEGREKLRERRERIAANELLAEVRKHRIQEKREGLIQLALEERIDEHLAVAPAAPKNPYVCEPDCESPRCPAKLWEQKQGQPATSEEPARCRDCGGSLTVIPDGFGEAYTCPRCDPAAVRSEPLDGCECPGAHECGVTTSTAANERRTRSKVRERIAEYHGNGDDLESALACLRSHEPDVRIIGNVRASTLSALLTRSAAEQRLLDACRFAVTRVAHMGCEVLQLTHGSQQQIAEAVVAWREEARTS